MDGLKKKLEPPPPKGTILTDAAQQRNYYSPVRGKKKGTVVDPSPLPTSLPDALNALKNNEVLVNSLGEDFVRWFCGVKEKEMETIDAEVEKEGLSHRIAWERMYSEFL